MAILLPDLPTLAEIARDRVAPAKPSKLVRQVAKHTAKVTRRKAKVAEDRADQKQDAIIRAMVFDRDQSRSRASGKRVKWASENPSEIGHAHHIQFSSLGGSDEPFNRVLLLPDEHDMAHAKGSKCVLDIHGDANATLTFVKRHLETGQIVKEWTSPCPTETRSR